MPEKIVKIHNGINAEKLEFFSREEARKKLSEKSPTFDIQQSTFVIGAIANFYKTKGLEYLIKAAHLLNTKYKLQDTSYVIIGDGKQRKKLESLIKKNKLENQVFLLGKIPDAYKFLRAFDIFVLPSLKEGLPWVILEAMASETPILATKVGALPEMIENEKQGILIEPKNSQELAEKISWLLSHRTEAEDMTLKAEEKVKKEFSIKEMLDKTKRLLPQ